jgi:hypothetical protein
MKERYENISAKSLAEEETLQNADYYVLLLII